MLNLLKNHQIYIGMCVAGLGMLYTSWFILLKIDELEKKLEF